MDQLYIINLTRKEITKTNFSKYENYLILSQKKNLNLSNVILVDDFPIKFSKDAKEIYLLGDLFDFELALVLFILANSSEKS